MAFRVFRRVRRGAHPKSARGIRPSPLEGAAAFSGQIQEPMLGPAPSAPSPLKKRPIEENTHGMRDKAAQRVRVVARFTEPLGGCV